MLSQILDLHIHSKYSRACSKQLELPNIARACEMKGIDIVVTGDMTHPAWYEHIVTSLEETQEGIYTFKHHTSKTKFILGTELSSIKKHKNKTRRIHVCVYAPNIAVLETFNKELARRNINLKSDGRPILGMTCKDILAMMLDIDERMMMIPAHAWTPWFGVFGSKGGYDSLEECFEELTPHIRAIETGLSSDPIMNWQLSQLDNITLVSNSDAHSLQKLGREANVLQFDHEQDITYQEICRIIQEGDAKKFLHTIEFYPEEGKYHADGHASCHVVFTPQQTIQHQGKCPACKQSITCGVEYRVHELATRSKEEARKSSAHRIPYKYIVPLQEILADALGVGVTSKKVEEQYQILLQNVGNEFFILLHAHLQDIERVTSARIKEAIHRVRTGNILVEPGYDGIFGKVHIFENNNHHALQQLPL